MWEEVCRGWVVWWVWWLVAVVGAACLSAHCSGSCSAWCLLFGWPVDFPSTWDLSLHGPQEKACSKRSGTRGRGPAKSWRKCWECSTRTSGHLGFDGGRVPQLARSQVSIFDPSLRRWLPLQVVWVRAGFAVLVASRTRCTFSKVESRCLWARYLGLPANGAKCTVPALSAGAFGLHVAFVLFTLPLVYRVALNVSVFVCRGYGGAIAMPGYTDPAKELLWWWHPEEEVYLFKPHVRWKILALSVPPFLPRSCLCFEAPGRNPTMSALRRHWKLNFEKRAAACWPRAPAMFERHRPSGSVVKDYKLPRSMIDKLFVAGLFCHWDSIVTTRCMETCQLANFAKAPLPAALFWAPKSGPWSVSSVFDFNALEPFAFLPVRVNVHGLASFAFLKSDSFVMMVTQTSFMHGRMWASAQFSFARSAQDFFFPPLDRPLRINPQSVSVSRLLPPHQRQLQNVLQNWLPTLPQCRAVSDDFRSRGVVQWGLGGGCMSVQIKFATRKVVQLQLRDDFCCTERYQLLVAKTPGASKHTFL